MKKYYLPVLVFIALCINACTDPPIGDDFADNQYVAEGNLLTVSNVVNGFLDLGDPDNAFVSFDLGSDARGEAASGVDVKVIYNGGEEVSFTTLSSLPATVNVTMQDALDAIGLTINDIEVGDAIRFVFDGSSSSGVYRSQNTLNVPFSCKSDLAGTYNTSTVDYFCDGGELTGTVTLTQVSAGEYTLDTWAFGTYPECYGGNAASWGTLRLIDVCNTLSISGVDNYGDSWTWNDVTVDGANLSFSWTMTYGEFGTTTITRTDGSEWPPLK